MLSKKIIKEAYWLRAISCLAVVVTHVVNTTLANYAGISTQYEEYTLILLRFIAFFGTPTFIFISEFLLARAYPEGVPEDFFVKRVKYLLFPFIFMAFVFAIIVSNNTREVVPNFYNNVFLAGFYGYFILIIFQFYILHILFHRKLKKWPIHKVLSISLLITLAYLGFFNFTQPMNIPLGEQIWQRGYWLFFFGWLFYFTLGYYCGIYYEELKDWLRENKILVYSMPVVGILIIVILVRTDILTVVSSKRVDMIFYTVSMIFAIILFSSQFKTVPKVILGISKYSFHIYLLHKVFLYYLKPIPIIHPFAYFLFAFVFCITGSILISRILSLIKGSSLFIGKTLVTPNKDESID